MKIVKLITLITIVGVGLGCSQPDRPTKTLPGVHTDHDAGEVGGQGGEGGQGGDGGRDAGPCDPWVDQECCIESSYCKNTSCEVDMQLCGGVCQGKPNPAVNVPCGDGGTCIGKICSE